MINAVPDLKTAILERIDSGALRGDWTPQDFLDLGARDAVDETLQRLTSAVPAKIVVHIDVRL